MILLPNFFQRPPKQPTRTHTYAHKYTQRRNMPLFAEKMPNVLLFAEKMPNVLVFAEKMPNVLLFAEKIPNVLLS